jgi:hypothetical protein
MPIWADKPHALDGQYPADFYVRPLLSSTWINLGAVRGAVATWDGTEIVDILSDNRGSLKSFYNLSATISATLLEIQDPDKFNLFYNSTRTLVAGTPVAVTGEAVGTSVASGTTYTLANANGNGTAVASITVSDTGGAFTDYVVSVVNGKTNIVFTDASTGATVVNYTYTPNQAVKEDMKTGANESKNFEVKLEVSLEWKVRTVTISSARLNTALSTNFADIVEAGDVPGSEVTFESNKGATVTYYDEILG